MNNRISKSINQNLKLNENPHIYPGYIESLPGQFATKNITTNQLISDQYTVSNPTVQADFYLYTVLGPDPTATCELVSVLRRFSQFTALREALLQRFTGIYLPPLPPKQITKNKS